MIGNQNPDYRVCPVTGRTVVIAPERAHRPHATVPQIQRIPNRSTDCPFCPGQEHETPPELFALRNETGWQLRVVPNRYPAVRPDSAAYGFHEVLIECAAHLESPTEFTIPQLARVFVAYRERLLHHRRNPEIASVALFKNVGRASGASQAHAHSQLIALPFVPELCRVGWDRPTCPFCPLLAETSRIVTESERFVVVCPFAPRFAYEMWVLPRSHEQRFEESTGENELAIVMKGVLSALEATLPGVSWNWFLRTAPRDAPANFHWHFEIIPRTTTIAGFEWSSGVFINDTPPEQATTTLRNKLLT